MASKLLSFYQFRSLPLQRKIRQLRNGAVDLGLGIICPFTHTRLYAYHDFYVESVIDRASGVVLDARPFKSMNRLAPYLELVCIQEIAILLSLR